MKHLLIIILLAVAVGGCESKKEVKEDRKQSIEVPIPYSGSYEMKVYDTAGNYTIWVSRGQKARHCVLSIHPVVDTNATRLIPLQMLSQKELDSIIKTRVVKNNKYSVVHPHSNGRTGIIWKENNPYLYKYDSTFGLLFSDPPDTFNIHIGSDTTQPFFKVGDFIPNVINADYLKGVTIGFLPNQVSLYSNDSLVIRGDTVAVIKKIIGLLIKKH